MKEHAIDDVANGFGEAGDFSVAALAGGWGHFEGDRGFGESIRRGRGKGRVGWVRAAEESIEWIWFVSDGFSFHKGELVCIGLYGFVIGLYRFVNGL